ncbi:hypothetical protein ACFFWD_15320 [Bradyrhizobium erythrophlei]|uniref:hypothetical protein n=1 Tax=Bradyrhizobium erythrophlei TaxID=1437360 RepID=UPI0035EE56A4
MTRALPLAALALIAITAPWPAQAQELWQGRELWPAVPPELGFRSPPPYGWIPYRCSDRQVLNFYHGALYHEPPAVYRGYVYRPYYRYTAARIVPRVYACAE